MSVPHFRGHFITIEGGEGAGKTTLLNNLFKALTDKGYEVVRTREPGGTDLGEEIRSWLLRKNTGLKIGKNGELLLILAARAQHLEEVIRPALEAGKIVLCDRFNDSTIAYQGYGQGLPLKYVQQLCHLVCDSLEPQLTFLIEIDPKIGLTRTQKIDKEHAIIGEFDRMESHLLDFHERVEAGFHTLAQKEPLRIYRLKGTDPFSDLVREALRVIDELLLLPNAKS